MRRWPSYLHNKLLARLGHGAIPAGTLTILLAGVIGVLAGFGAVLFTLLIETISQLTVESVLSQVSEHRAWFVALCACPALGLLLVSWFTRRFAPEAQGHGVPEVITAVARHDGVIRPRVSLVKILASCLCIGTGGSIGREGPIVQIGSSLGSMFGQTFKLSARNIKVLVAAGAAAGISATFNAPLAGVMFASEIILGSFAVESLTPIVIASVLADVVQVHFGEHRSEAAFPHLYHAFEGAWVQLPPYVLLGLVCGLAAVGFTKLLYGVDDLGQRYLPKWWMRAVVFGGLVGLGGVLYPLASPAISPTAGEGRQSAHHVATPPLFGVGYGVVDHALHLQNVNKPSASDKIPTGEIETAESKIIQLDPTQMLAELWWLLPLALLKPLMTSLTLGGGGSGGIFAPSLFTGATVGASFGLVCNLFIPPEWCANPGVYAIVGMGAVVAGTTHGVLSAILIVYEMTGNYFVILPIMVASGLSSLVAMLIDPESIYHKKLSRRGETIARGHDMHRMEHIMVRDVMVRHFPAVKHTDNVTGIIRVAQANPHIESLPVMNDEDRLIGIIRPEDLHRVLDSDIPPQLVNAEDIALATPLSVAPDENLLEALRDFGTRDIETLPVESGQGPSKRLVGLLMRSDVMRRYRQEMLRRT
jgi:CIC family chloride channel protein